MQWLINLGQEYRSHLRSNLFYKQLSSTSNPADIRGWVRQLYYQSRDFTSALSLRYSVCRETQFQGCFAKHAMEEVDHCEQLIDWMRHNHFLEPDESPTSVAATLETISVSAYCFRSVLRESCTHQIIALNLISEGVSYDFFSAVIPKLKQLNLQVGRYWQVHKEIDQIHLAMGLDLIPQCDEHSPEGKVYSRIAWEMTRLYDQMLTSWCQLSPSHQNNPFLYQEQTGREWQSQSSYSREINQEQLSLTGQYK